MEAMLWPYYIICEDLLLVLSASLDHAMLLAEPSSIKLCHTEMERLLSLSRPLLHRSSSAWESIACYQEMHKKDIPVHSVLEFQPCVSSFVPSSQYAKLLPSITQAGGNPALIREFFQLSSVPFKYQSICVNLNSCGRAMGSVGPGFASSSAACARRASP